MRAMEQCETRLKRQTYGRESMMGKIPEEETRLLSNELSELDLEEEYHQHNLSLPKRPILYSLWMGSFLGSIDSTIVANIMNRVAEEFAESDKKQWIVTSFLLTNTAFQPLYGKLSDITGRKTALLTAHFFFLVGCLLTCFARNLTEFSVSRAICGIGAGGISALSSITVSDICTPKERGIYQGYANVVFGTGSLLGGPIGGIVMEHFGWKVIFACQVPLIMTCMFLGYRNVNVKLVHLPPKHEIYTWKNLKRIDLGGSASLVCTIFGFLCLNSTDLNKYLLLAFTIVSFITFIVNELYWAPERILPIELLTGPFGFASLLTVLSSFIQLGDVFRNPIYLQIIQNISLTSTGGFLLFSSITGALSSLFTGWVLRHTKMELARCSYMLVAIAAISQFISLVLGYLLLSHLSPNPTSYLDGNSFTYIQSGSSSSVWLQWDDFRWRVVYVISMVLVSFGYAMLLVSTLVSIVFTIPKSQQATITGCFYLWRSIGTVLGASSVLTIYESSVSSNLYDFLHPLGMDAECNILLHNTSYLRKHFKGKLLEQLLQIYNDGFLTSYILSISVGMLSVMFALKLYASYSKVDKENSESENV